MLNTDDADPGGFGGGCGCQRGTPFGVALSAPSEMITITGVACGFCRGPLSSAWAAAIPAPIYDSVPTPLIPFKAAVACAPLCVNVCWTVAVCVNDSTPTMSEDNCKSPTNDSSAVLAAYSAEVGIAAP